MKKLILIFLSLLIVFSLTSCGESKAKNGDSSDSANAEGITVKSLRLFLFFLVLRCAQHNCA